MELKILALLYFFGLSSETNNFLSLFEEISHESVRIYYYRPKKVLIQPKKEGKKVNSDR